MLCVTGFDLIVHPEILLSRLRLTTISSSTSVQHVAENPYNNEDDVLCAVNECCEQQNEDIFTKGTWNGNIAATDGRNVFTAERATFKKLKPPSIIYY